MGPLRSRFPTEVSAVPTQCQHLKPKSLSTAFSALFPRTLRLSKQILVILEKDFVLAKWGPLSFPLFLASTVLQFFGTQAIILYLFLDENLTGAMAIFHYKSCTFIALEFHIRACADPFEAVDRHLRLRTYKSVLTNTVATSLRGLFKFKGNKIKNSFFQLTILDSSVQEPHVAHGYNTNTGQCGYRSSLHSELHSAVNIIQMTEYSVASEKDEADLSICTPH